MTFRFVTPRIVRTAAICSLLGVGSARAAEPISAPPSFPADAFAIPEAPLVPGAAALAPGNIELGPSTGSLAPIDTSLSLPEPQLGGPLLGAPIDATTTEGVVPAGRRDGLGLGDIPGGRRADRPLAPYTMEAPGDSAARRPARGGSGQYGAIFEGSSGGGSYNGGAYPGSSYGSTVLPGGPGAIGGQPGASGAGQSAPLAQLPDDAATVRISDRPSETTTGDVPGVRPSTHICPHCRYSPNGIPYHLDPDHDPPAAMMRRYARRHGVTLPPDYGWSPPAHNPIDRVSIDYYRAFPASWNGQGPCGPGVVRPTVYWPTDTTQLGYTYQHTPRWMPYPGMVPPVPHPGQWHVPLYGHAGGVCPAGHPHLAGEPYAANTPARPAATPAPQQASAGPTLPAPGGLQGGPELKSAGAPELTPVPF